MTRLIDADALRDKIIQRTIEEDTEFPEYDWGTGLSIAKDILERMPTVDAVPVRHGRLINAHPYGECSWCGELIDSRAMFRYCPFCGAKIGDKDETNKCG